MRNFLLSLRGALAVSLALATAAPVMAAPAFAPNVPSASSELIQVQQTRKKRRAERREARQERRQERRAERREARQERRAERRERRFERRGERAYLNGRRGYREHRSGYRRYNGFWFPAAAFTIVIETRPAVRAYSNSHVSWCYDRWRSYRASDNTYQPYNGPRRACVSPYS